MCPFPLPAVHPSPLTANLAPSAHLCWPASPEMCCGSVGSWHWLVLLGYRKKISRRGALTAGVGVPIVVEAGIQDQSIDKLGFPVSSLRLAAGYLL